MAPNGAGTHTEELKKLDAVFAKIASPVEEFAKRYHLLISKYYHDASSWDLPFKRKSGGYGQIQILLIDPPISVYSPQSLVALSEPLTRAEFKIFASCHIDDYDAQVRSTHGEEIGTWRFGVNSEDRLAELLELALKTALSWKPSDLADRYQGYQWKKTWKTKSEFEKASDSALINNEIKALPLL